LPVSAGADSGVVGCLVFIFAFLFCEQVPYIPTVISRGCIDCSHHSVNV